MQGSYNNNGLPRPYYMKPVLSKKHSPYDKMPNTFFTTNKRKLLGYMMILFLFGSCMYLVSQELKPGPDPVYELVHSNSQQAAKVPNDNTNIDHMVDSIKNADRETEKAGLAGNLAQGSKGDIGHGVVEAPKGGIANEAPVVGNDADSVVGNGKGQVDANGKAKPKSYRANKGDEPEVKEPIENQAPYKKDSPSNRINEQPVKDASFKSSNDKSVQQIMDETEADADDFKVKANS